MFGGLINNITVSVTRDATLPCIVENLSSYKVAWLRVDTQTILTIAGQVITKNHRIAVTHSDQRTWSLHIKDVRESDQGWYMCQLNTDPMKSQTAFLEVVVPPDILDYPTSTDMVVREGNDVTLRCAASGSPTPTVAWRREASRGISLGNGTSVPAVDGPFLRISKVTRHDMGAYLCIASNGIPPTVSKRILLIVHFPPSVTVGKQLVGAVENYPVSLECLSEAFPKAINYWTRDRGEILTSGTKYDLTVEESSYKVVMKLTIKNVTSRDFGTYKCVSKNSLGDTEGTMKVYRKYPDPVRNYPSNYQL
ncbi:UNVERIFIED_CONTAM: hypothetical protein PYX00_002951 [Menopon gallinae]|uniref:Ig-like domain-containing protein n=1 Tax=Menopon gallinae TaxID=328185 RepID=A0AAW2HZI8_9NEOP